MITCGVCNTANDHLAIICSSCGGFLQGRVDNLDLFSTAWKIIESPRRAMRTVAIAKHKNYGIVLSGIAGIALIFFVFWLFKLGDHVQTIVNLLGAGLVVGPVMGIITVLTYTTVILLITKITRSRAGFRNIMATTSYALIPLVISVILLLPIEIMTFGTFFFVSNPSPYLLRPGSYIILLALDGICGLWTLILLFIGMKTLLDTGWLRSMSIVTVSLLMLGTGMWFILQSLITGL